MEESKSASRSINSTPLAYVGEDGMEEWKSASRAGWW
jgi:hypothetical protein